MNIEKLPTRYFAGTASVQAGGTIVTPHDAAWTGNIWGDDLFFLPSQPLVPPVRIETVNADNTLTLAYGWPGAAATEEPYEIRYVGIIERSTAQTRRVLEELGEVSAYFDVQVNTIADRAAFDDRPTGWRVLVSDVGGGLAEIFSKVSNAAADWSDGAPLGAIGPEGPIGPIGITWRGLWNAATVYAARDGVLYNGSSWRAKQAGTNQAPPSLPTVENAYWFLISQAGTNGTGTGDVVGPASSISGRVALFSGTTGKLLTQAGLSISDLEPARALVTQAEAEAGTVTGIRGWTPQRVAQAIAALSSLPADVYRRSNALGTVSQVGGLPTGAIIERGSNANGEYIRFADGLQICTKIDLPGTSISAPSGSIYRSASLVSWTYPAEFISPPLFFGNTPATSSAWSGVGSDASATVSGSYRLFSSVSDGSVRNLNVCAIGRWF